MQTDKRWGVVLQELTGIDFDAMGSKQKDDDAADEVSYEATMAAKAKRDAADEAERKAQEDAALPNEEREKKEKAYKAEQLKAQGNDFYKSK